MRTTSPARGPAPSNGQLTSLRGIVVRDLQHMWRYRSSYYLMFGTAVTLPLVYYAQALGFAGDSAEAQESFTALSGTSQVAGFIYLGWAVFMWVSVVLYGPASALRTERVRGTLENVLLTPVSRITLLLGTCIAPMVPTVLMFGVVCSFMWGSIGVSLSWHHIFVLAAIIIVSTPALIAIGMALSSLTVLTRDSDGAIAITQAIVSVMCGVTYPIAVLPEALQWLSQTLPPTHTILLMRSWVLGNGSLAETGPRVAYLLVAAAVLIVVADLALRRALSYGRRTGRLGQF